MDNFFRQQESDEAQQSSGFLTNLRIVDRVLHWLAGLIQLTEEEQSDAGIYFGG